MSLTELFIRRPVMTVLLNIALIAVGLTALGKIPVAALPRYDTPTSHDQTLQMIEMRWRYRNVASGGVFFAWSS